LGVCNTQLPLLLGLLLFCSTLSAQNQTPEQQADALYDRIMNADGFDEAAAYEMLGDIYPEYQITTTAGRAYDQALASDNPAEIARIGSSLVRQQHQPLQQIQQLLLRLRSLPPSDTLNRALAVLLMERNYQLPTDNQEYTELLQLLGAPASDQLADPLDWDDPALALEALLERYRAPLPEQADAVELQARLQGLEHCLQLLHYLRQARDTEKDRLALAATVPPLAYRALSIALQLDREQPQGHWRNKAYQLAEQAKATLLADRLQGFQADRTDVAWPKLGQQLRLARQLAAESGSFFAQSQRLRELVDDHFGSSNLMSWPPPPQSELDVAQIQVLLNEQSALLVSYFRIGDEGIVFALDGQQISIEPFYWNRETQTALRQLRQEMEGKDFLREPEAAYQRFCTSSFWLYENLLLRPALRHCSIKPQYLVILPDAELWDIPFAALISRAPEGTAPSYSNRHLDYLINDYAISLAPSSRSWLRLSQLPNDKLKVAAMAPDFTGEAIANRQACNGLLTALPHSVSETEAILEAVAGQAFLGTAAQLANLQIEESTFSVWHLATHACRQTDAPDQSAVYLQDGPLTAQEIAQLPLHLQLVVLSACETQVGPYRPGEGVLSIGRAFLQAGARAMIGSLWPVSDAATAQLMPLFYESLASGDAASVALQQAQLHFLQQQDRLTAHPHYWAGFVLVGPAVEFKNAYPLWQGLLLVFGSCVLFGAFVYRRRAS
jgi:CHAT domain-containing protein